jgi:hypothetical protein
MEYIACCVNLMCAVSSVQTEYIGCCFVCTEVCRVKKLSLYSPVGVQEVEALRICRQLAHVSGKIVSAMHRPPLPLKEDLLYTFLLEAEYTLGS